MTTSTFDPIINHHLDTQGLICPEPVMMLHKTIRKADGGDIIEVLATDPATTRDIPNFCRHLGHELLHHEMLDDIDLNADPDEITIDTDNNMPVSASLYRYLVKKSLFNVCVIENLSFIN